MHHTTKTWVEVSREALQRNVQEYKKILPHHLSVMGVVKSNAYGHGLVETAKALAPHLTSFGVVFIEEALTLRESGNTLPILVFSTTTFEQALLQQAIENDITLSIYDSDSYEQIRSAAKACNKPARVQVNIDTGMSRLGFSKEQYTATIIKLCRDEHLILEGIYSHLSSADTNVVVTKQQCDQFEEHCAEAEAVGCTEGERHILNSPAVLLGCRSGTMARIGLGLFGLSPSPITLESVRVHHPTFLLYPALSWKTRVMHLHTVEKNKGIGYGGMYTTKEKTLLATLPVGFADGYRRAFSNKGEVLIKGVRCPVRGRVCMNNTMVEVTHLPTIAVGEEVVLLGASGEAYLTAEELAEQIDSNPAEIVSSISESLPRFYF